MIRRIDVCKKRAARFFDPGRSLVPRRNRGVRMIYLVLTLETKANLCLNDAPPEGTVTGA
jgi:hypothetical protein